MVKNVDFMAGVGVAVCLRTNRAACLCAADNDDDGGDRAEPRHRVAYYQGLVVNEYVELMVI